MTEAPPKEDLVTVTIDGIEVSVPKGTLLIRAAEQLGISVPRFCDHPLLDPAGACRQCLVEVTDMGNGRGMPKPAASCTTTVMPGMVIKTQLTSVVADKAQQGVMELLLINHPLDCPVCDKGGECPLQNQAMSNGRAESRFHEQKRTFPKPVAISSNVLLDRERCVLCQRCTRFSLQIAGDPFIELLERGAEQQIGTSDEVPFQSYFSGNTVQICPVGALTERQLPLPRPARSTSCRASRCASTARPAARSAPTGAARRSPAGWPATTPRSTRSGTATRVAGRSTTPRRPTASSTRWCATPTARSSRPAGPRRSSARRRASSRPSPAAASACCPAAG